LRENSAANLTTSDRVLAANHDVQQLLEHVGKGGKVYPAVLEYLKVIQELTADLLKNPMGEDWKKEFAERKSDCLSSGRRPSPSRKTFMLSR
jgi:hypothetical protein